MADDAETLEIGLIENIQRKDLTPFEEADGLHRLGTQFEYTHEDIAKKIGRARSSGGHCAAASRERSCGERRWLPTAGWFRRLRAGSSRQPLELIGVERFAARSKQLV